jgi:hypothetical protein
MYIVQSRVRKLIHNSGKRATKSYMQYLERRVHDIVVRHIGLLGSRQTMNAEDAEALDAYKMTRA